MLQSQYPIQYNGIIPHPVEDDVLCEWFPETMRVSSRRDDELSGYVVFMLEGGLEAKQALGV